MVLHKSRKPDGLVPDGDRAQYISGDKPIWRHNRKAPEKERESFNRGRLALIGRVGVAGLTLAATLAIGDIGSQAGPAPPKVEAAPATTTASLEAPPEDLPDFMSFVQARANITLQARSSTPDGSPHSCGDMQFDIMTGPDLTTAEGWLNATNQLRAMYDKPPLVLNNALTMSAHNTANMLTAADEFRHLSLGGTIGRFVPEGVQYGENLGTATDDHELNEAQLSVFACFVDSRGHLGNMLEDYTDMGVALGQPYGADGDNSALHGKRLDVIQFANIPK